MTLTICNCYICRTRRAREEAKPKCINPVRSATHRWREKQFITAIQALLCFYASLSVLAIAIIFAESAVRNGWRFF